MALEFFSLSVEAVLHSHHERDSVGWILAKLTGRKRSLELHGNDPVFDGVLHHLGTGL